jgi:hypothetical protein
MIWAGKTPGDIWEDPTDISPKWTADNEYRLALTKAALREGSSGASAGHVTLNAKGQVVFIDANGNATIVDKSVKAPSGNVTSVNSRKGTQLLGYTQDPVTGEFKVQPLGDPLDAPFDYQKDNEGNIIRIDPTTGESSVIHQAVPQIEEMGGFFKVPHGQGLQFTGGPTGEPVGYDNNWADWRKSAGLPAVGGGQDGPAWTPPVPPDRVVGTGNKFGDQVSMEGTHKGTDLQAYEGEPAVSPVDGTVVDVRNEPEGLGLRVIIQDASGELHELSHLEEGSISVQPGDEVRAGEQVASVGSSGAGSTGPHMDYRIQDQEGNYENPEMRMPELASLPMSPNTVGVDDEQRSGVGQGADENNWNKVWAKVYTAAKQKGITWGDDHTLQELQYKFENSALGSDKTGIVSRAMGHIRAGGDARVSTPNPANRYRPIEPEFDDSDMDKLTSDTKKRAKNGKVKTVQPAADGGTPPPSTPPTAEASPAPEPRNAEGLTKAEIDAEMRRNSARSLLEQIKDGTFEGQPADKQIAALQEAGLWEDAQAALSARDKAPAWNPKSPGVEYTDPAPYRSDVWGRNMGDGGTLRPDRTLNNARTVFGSEPGIPDEIPADEPKPHGWKHENRWGRPITTESAREYPGLTRRMTEGLGWRPPQRSVAPENIEVPTEGAGGVRGGYEVPEEWVEKPKPAYFEETSTGETVERPRWRPLGGSLETPSDIPDLQDTSVGPESGVRSKVNLPHHEGYTPPVDEGPRIPRDPYYRTVPESSNIQADYPNLTRALEGGSDKLLQRDPTMMERMGNGGLGRYANPLTGAALGAIEGAVNDEGDRAGGAVKGAGMGAIGGVVADKLIGGLLRMAPGLAPVVSKALAPELAIPLTLGDLVYRLSGAQAQEEEAKRNGIDWDNPDVQENYKIMDSPEYWKMRMGRGGWQDSVGGGQDTVGIGAGRTYDTEKDKMTPYGMNVGELFTKQFGEDNAQPEWERQNAINYPTQMVNPPITNYQQADLDYRYNTLNQQNSQYQAGLDATWRNLQAQLGQQQTQISNDYDVAKAQLEQQRYMFDSEMAFKKAQQALDENYRQKMADVQNQQFYAQQAFQTGMAQYQNAFTGGENAADRQMQTKQQQWQSGENAAQFNRQMAQSNPWLQSLAGTMPKYGSASWNPASGTMNAGYQNAAQGVNNLFNAAWTPPTTGGTAASDARIPTVSVPSANGWTPSYGTVGGQPQTAQQQAAPGSQMTTPGQTVPQQTGQMSATVMPSGSIGSQMTAPGQPQPQAQQSAQSGMPDWGTFKGWDPYQKSAFMYNQNMAGKSNGEVGSELVNQWGSSGGPTSMYGTTGLAAAKQDQVGRANTEATASIFGNNPTDYWQQQQKTWNKGSKAPNVTQSA